MKSLLKVNKVGVTAKPVLDYIITSKKGRDPKLRSSDIIVSDDLRHLDLKTTIGRLEAALKIESYSRKYCTRRYTTRNQKRVEARHRDHYTISAPYGVCHKEFRKALNKALRQLCDDLNIKTFVCSVHSDTKCPHAHIVCESYAPSIGVGKRRKICNTKLEMLNENSWTDVFDAPTVEAVSEISERSKNVKKKMLRNWSNSKLELGAILHFHKIHKTSDLIKIKAPSIQRDLYAHTHQPKSSNILIN